MYELYINRAILFLSGCLSLTITRSGVCVCACSWNSLILTPQCAHSTVDRSWLVSSSDDDRYYCYKHFGLCLLVNILVHFCWVYRIFKVFFFFKKTLSFSHSYNPHGINFCALREIESQDLCVLYGYPFLSRYSPPWALDYFL